MWATSQPFLLPTVRTASYAVRVANLVHPRRVLYVTSESLENVGYGISVAVLYLAIFQFLRTSEQPRLPKAKALSALPLALVVPTAAFSVVLAPLGYAYLYERDDAGSNSAGLRVLLASYWVRTAQAVVHSASSGVLQSLHEAEVVVSKVLRRRRCL